MAAHQIVVLSSGSDLDMVDALWRGNDTADVYAAWCALCQERLIAQFHAASRGEHGVCDDKCLLVDAWCGEVFHVNADLMMLFVLVFTVGRYEGVTSMVEDIEEALVERQSGTEDGGKNYLVRRDVHAGYSQRCGYIVRLVVEGLRYLEGLILTDAAYVVAEKKTVLLIVLVANFSHVLAYDAVFFR